MYCAEHALGGMVRDVSRTSATDGFLKQPSYELSGSRKREYCAEHASEGMANVSSHKYSKGGCSTNSRRGVFNASKRKDSGDEASEDYSIMPQQTKISGVGSSSVGAGLDDGDVVKVEFGVSW